MYPRRYDERMGHFVAEKCSDRAAAITTQDTVIQRIIERCQETELKVNELNSDLLVNKVEKIHGNQSEGTHWNDI